MKKQAAVPKNSRTAMAAEALARAVAAGNSGDLGEAERIARDEGDFARAAERFRRVLAADPAHPRARLNLGYYLIERGELDEGIACLRAAVEAAPHSYSGALKMLISASRGRF